jgi:hypothetical protein
MVDGAQLPAGLEQEAEAAILRVVEQMERAKTDRERAIGVSVRASLAAQAAFAAATGGDMQKCSETPGCWDRANKAQQRAVAPSAENLARLAATTHDPQTYAAAFRACHAFRTDPAAAASCANLRAEQLAQLDPDNATSWFEVANEAANRKDDKAVESALLRAAQGKRVDSLLLPYLDLTKGIDIHYEPVRTLILMRLAGSYFAQPLPPYAVISTYCSKEMAGSPGRKDGCMALASLLAERGPDLLAVRLGAAIGERAGWPADRIAHYAEERKAIDAEMVRATPGVGSLDCDWSARLETWVAGVTNHGEAGYIRQRLAKRQAR